MRIQRAAAIIFFDLAAETLVALHNVEDIPKHFKSGDVRRGAHGGGAWIKAHARHFAEQIARTEFSNGLFNRQVSRAVDGNRATRRFLVAVIFRAASEAARKL